ncbi:putative MFS hexose transporter [Aureobasidium pullulans]|nr:putative MFS hexose transporter [Aureobasidium pullulans]
MAPTAAKTTNDISSSIDLSSIAPFYKRKNGILLYLLLTTSLLSSFASGFDGTNAMQLLPIWQEKFGNPTGSTLGLFGASTSIGGLVPLIFFNWMGDYFGRRVPTAVGALIIIVGALVELFSSTLSMFIGGKVVIGLGSTMVQLGAPVLVTELTHPKERAKVTTVYNTGVYLGYVIGAWVTFGCIKINTDWQWKLPTLLQVIPSVYQLTLLWFCPESPRWLIAKGKEDQARAILVKYHGECDPNSELVGIEMSEIIEAQAREAAANVNFLSNHWQLTRSNYLAKILKDTGLDSTFDSTLINGMSTLWSYICSLAVAGFVDRFNRRTFFLTGSIGSLVVFVAWTIAAQQYVDEGSIAAGRFIVACIFLFQAFYTIGWLNFVDHQSVAADRIQPDISNRFYTYFLSFPVMDLISPIGAAIAIAAQAVGAGFALNALCKGCSTAEKEVEDAAQMLAAYEMCLVQLEK